MARTGNEAKISFNEPQLPQGNLTRAISDEEDECDGFYETQMLIRNNIKQINKHSKLITTYTERYKFEMDIKNIKDINLNIEDIIQNNTNITNVTQQCIKMESDKISTLFSNKVKDPETNRAKGESLNVLIQSFKKAIKFYYLSLSIYNQTVCNKQMEQINILTDNLTNNDIEQLMCFDAEERQSFIHEKFANFTNTPRIQAIQSVQDLERQRKGMKIIQENVEQMKQLNASLTTLNINGDDDDDEMDEQRFFFQSPKLESMVIQRSDQINLDAVDRTDTNIKERRSPRRRHGCKIWCVVWTFIAAVITFAILDVQLNGKWL